MSEIFFETFNVPGLYRELHGTLSLYASGSMLQKHKNKTFDFFFNLLVLYP